MVLFALWQGKAREPLVPLGLFRSVPLSAGVLLMVLMAFAFFGAIFFVTFYLQNVHGMKPVEAGVHLLPMTGMMIVGSPIAGIAIGKLGPRIPITAGMLITTAAMFGMSTLDTGSGTGVMSLWFVLMGLASARSSSAPPRSSSATRRWSCPAWPAACSRRRCRSAAAWAPPCWAR